jgi:dihydroorotate dehydrogenase (fumarate)
MLSTLEEWMTRKGFNSLSDFRGKMSQAKSSNPAAYERVQFMRYFGGVH